ncbi:MAG: hypothetical protein DMG06_29000 [Acidobacteria bacterium]|nr:MAG: hypothetical protein DMG06_29000 [Acidobacteriota bacterium]
MGPVDCLNRSLTVEARYNIFVPCGLGQADTVKISLSRGESPEGAAGGSVRIFPAFLQGHPSSARTRPPFERGFSLGVRFLLPPHSKVASVMPNVLARGRGSKPCRFDRKRSKSAQSTSPLAETCDKFAKIGELHLPVSSFFNNFRLELDLQLVVIQVADLRRRQWRNV